MDGARPVRAARGTTLTARSWQTEAPLRMLANNLDPEVAERPDDLVRRVRQERRDHLDGERVVVHHQHRARRDLVLVQPLDGERGAQVGPADRLLQDGRRPGGQGQIGVGVAGDHDDRYVRERGVVAQAGHELPAVDPG